MDENLGNSVTERTNVEIVQNRKIRIGNSYASGHENSNELESPPTLNKVDSRENLYSPDTTVKISSIWDTSTTNEVHHNDGSGIGTSSLWHDNSDRCRVVEKNDVHSLQHKDSPPPVDTIIKGTIEEKYFSCKEEKRNDESEQKKEKSYRESTCNGNSEIKHEKFCEHRNSSSVESSSQRKIKYGEFIHLWAYIGDKIIDNTNSNSTGGQKKFGGFVGYASRKSDQLDAQKTIGRKPIKSSRFNVGLNDTFLAIPPFAGDSKWYFKKTKFKAIKVKQNTRKPTSRLSSPKKHSGGKEDSVISSKVDVDLKDLTDRPNFLEYTEVDGKEGDDDTRWNHKDTKYTDQKTSDNHIDKESSNFIRYGEEVLLVDEEGGVLSHLRGRRYIRRKLQRGLSGEIYIKFLKDGCNGYDDKNNEGKINSEIGYQSNELRNDRERSKKLLDVETPQSKLGCFMRYGDTGITIQMTYRQSLKTTPTMLRVFTAPTETQKLSPTKTKAKNKIFRGMRSLSPVASPNNNSDKGSPKLPSTSSPLLESPPTSGERVDINSEVIESTLEEKESNDIIGSNTIPITDDQENMDIIIPNIEQTANGGFVNCINHGQSLFFMLEFAPPELSNVSITFLHSFSSEYNAEKVNTLNNRLSRSLINWKQTYTYPLFGQKINFYTITNIPYITENNRVDSERSLLRSKDCEEQWNSIETCNSIATKNTYSHTQFPTFNKVYKVCYSLLWGEALYTQNYLSKHSETNEFKFEQNKSKKLNERNIESDINGARNRIRSLSSSKLELSRIGRGAIISHIRQIYLLRKEQRNLQEKLSSKEREGDHIGTYDLPRQENIPPQGAHSPTIATHFADWLSNIGFPESPPVSPTSTNGNLDVDTDAYSLASTEHTEPLSPVASIHSSLLDSPSSTSPSLTSPSPLSPSDNNKKTSEEKLLEICQTLDERILNSPSVQGLIFLFINLSETVIQIRLTNNQIAEIHEKDFEEAIIHFLQEENRLLELGIHPYFPSSNDQSNDNNNENIHIKVEHDLEDLKQHRFLELWVNANIPEHKINNEINDNKWKKKSSKNSLLLLVQIEHVSTLNENAYKEESGDRTIFVEASKEGKNNDPLSNSIGKQILEKDHTKSEKESLIKSKSFLSSSITFPPSFFPGIFMGMYIGDHHVQCNRKQYMCFTSSSTEELWNSFMQYFVLYIFIALLWKTFSFLVEKIRKNSNIPSINDEMETENNTSTSTSIYFEKWQMVIVDWIQNDPHGISSRNAYGGKISSSLTPDSIYKYKKDMINRRRKTSKRNSSSKRNTYRSMTENNAPLTPVKITTTASSTLKSRRKFFQKSIRSTQKAGRKSLEKRSLDPKNLPTDQDEEYEESNFESLSFEGGGEEEEEENVYIPANFLEAENGDREKALLRYEKTLHWRALNDVDMILDKPHPQYENLRRLYPQFFHFHDKFGNVVIYEQVGRLNLPEATKLGISSDLFVHQALIRQEFLWNTLSPKIEDRVLLCLDLKGLKMTDITKQVIDLIKKSISISSSHYPARSFKMLLLNIPGWFNIIYSFVKPLLNDTMKAKILFVTESQILKTLQEYIEDEFIPKEYGGSCEVNLGESPAEKALMKKVTQVLDDHDILME